VRDETGVANASRHATVPSGSTAAISPELVVLRRLVLVVTYARPAGSTTISGTVSSPEITGERTGRAQTICGADGANATP
jgi:hypothetical protein